MWLHPHCYLSGVAEACELQRNPLGTHIGFYFCHMWNIPPFTLFNSFAQITPYSTFAQITPYSTFAQITPYSTFAQITPYPTFAQIYTLFNFCTKYRVRLQLSAVEN